MPVCKQCKHLIDDDPHVCPDEEYLRERDALIAAAAEAEEQCGYEACEAHLRKLKEKVDAKRKALQGDTGRPAQQAD